MTAEITMRQVWYNNSMLNMFFRSQARDTFEELYLLRREPYGWDDVLQHIEEMYDSLDEFEDDLYELGTDQMIEEIGREYFQEDEEEEEC